MIPTPIKHKHPTIGVGIVAAFSRNHVPLETFVELVRDAAIAEFHISREDFTRHTRLYKIVCARHICYYLTRLKYPKEATLKKVSRLFGYTQDHTTVINAEKQVRAAIETKSGKYANFCNVAIKFGIQL